METENGLFARLKAERDAAIELAEQAEARCLDMQKEYEANLENGYSEAYESVLKERQKTESLQSEKSRLEKEVASLRLQNDRLLEATNTNKNYADVLEAELLKKESDLIQEYHAKLKDQRDFMVNKLDDFLRIRLDSTKEYMVLSECERLMAKGGEELLREVLGEEGIELHKNQQERKQAEEQQANNMAKLRQAQARVVEEEAKQAKQSQPVDMRKLAKELLAKQIAQMQPKMLKEAVLASSYTEQKSSVENRVTDIVEKKLVGSGDVPPPTKHYR